MKRKLLILLVPLFLQGCAAVAPGLYMDDSRFQRVDAPEGVQAEEPVVIPITPGLLLEQSKQRAGQKTESKPAEAESTYVYRVGTGDILSVIVYDHPELTIPAGEYRPAESAGHLVDPDGNIFYPYVGSVHVGGKSTDQIRELLTSRLQTYIQNPQVEIRVAAFRSKKVYVTGEVAKPGVLPITDRPLTVIEAVNLSGGGTQESDLHNVLVTRGEQVIKVDIQALYRGEGAGNLVLRDGDQVHVSDRYDNKVFVLGEVKRPSTQAMNKGRLTLADALGAAEGVDPLTSDPSRIYVIRGDFTQPRVYQLNARSADALLLATGFELQPKDVIYVSVAGISRWNRIMTQIVPTIQAIWQTDVVIRSNR